MLKLQNTNRIQLPRRNFIKKFSSQIDSESSFIWRAIIAANAKSSRSKTSANFVRLLHLCADRLILCAGVVFCAQASHSCALVKYIDLLILLFAQAAGAVVGKLSMSQPMQMILIDC